MFIKLSSSVSIHHPPENFLVSNERYSQKTFYSGVWRYGIDFAPIKRFCPFCFLWLYIRRQRSFLGDFSQISVYMSVLLSVCFCLLTSVCLSFSLSFCLSFCLSFFLSFFLFFFLSFCLFSVCFVFLLVFLSFLLSGCPTVCLSLFLSVFPSDCLSV